VTNSTSLEVTSGPIADITVGSSVSGTSIPAGATVASKNASHIVISSATTGADSGTYIVKSDARFTVTVNNKIRIKTAVSEGSINRYWEYFGSFDKAPGQSEWLANLFAQMMLFTQ
jgi:hypothetical protein